LLDLSPVFLGLNSTNELAHEGYLVTCWEFDLQTAPRRGRMSHEHKASVNSDVISRIHFTSKQRTDQTDL